MSALPATDAPARPTRQPRVTPTPAPATPKPNLTVVAAPRPRVAGTGMFSLVIAAIMVVGMVVLLSLNTMLAEGAFQIHTLTKAQSQLNVRQQELVQSVAIAKSPEQLQSRALALGMVPSDNPVFIRIADGKLLGTPIPAPRPPRVRSVAAPDSLKSVLPVVKAVSGR